MSPEAVDGRRVTANLAAVRRRISATGRDPSRIVVVAVTKGFGPDAIRAAAAAGLGAVGENYAQELVAKHEAAAEVPVAWHFLGQLQTNKVRALAPHVSLWQSIDREALGVEVARRAPAAAVLVQVDLSRAPGRGGCALAEAPALVGRLGELGLDVRGLMAVGPPGAPEEARAGFRAVVAMADELGLAERSLGMSGDLEVAVEEGSTMVRVGTALFGPRPARPPAPGARH